MPPFGYPPTCPYHHEIEISELKRKIRLLSETCDAKDLRLKEMAEALDGLINCPASSWRKSMENAEVVLQKYHEQVGDTNAK